MPDSVYVSQGRLRNRLVGLSSVFVVDATGAGTISGKTYQAGTNPANKVLTGFQSNNDAVTVHVEVDARRGDWQPTITVRGGSALVTVTNLAPIATGSRRFTGSAAITAAASATITAEADDGATSGMVAYTRALNPPLVLTAIFAAQANGIYPAVQTQFKSGDTMRITGTTEAHATRAWLRDAGISSTLQGPFTVTAGAFDFTATVGTRASATQTGTVFADVGAGSTAGPDFVTTNTADQDQTAPTFSAVTFLYPTGQEALKNVETADVTITHTNIAAGDTYLYDTNGTGELTIPATTAYAATKTVTRLAGDYRETGTNYRLTATRTTKNGKAATASTTVKIAHVLPVITVTGATTRLGSGGGTQDFTITMTASQANLSTYTASVSLAVGTGDTSAWQGTGWTASGILAYTRVKRVLDADIKAGGQTPNNYTWGAMSVKNRAGKEAIVVTTNTTYQLGGFTTRTLNMGPITGGDPPYTHTANIGVPVVDTAKTTVVNTSKGGAPTQAYEAVVTEHNNADSSLNNFWTTVAALGSEAFDDFTKFFHCSDKKFYDSVTAPGGFNCTIAEAA